MVAMMTDRTFLAIAIAIVSLVDGGCPKPQHGEPP
jgi:hypothetical protein